MFRLFFLSLLVLQACDSSIQNIQNSSIKLNNVDLLIKVKGSANVKTHKNNIVLSGLGDCVLLECKSEVLFAPQTPNDADFHLQFNPLDIDINQAMVVKWGSSPTTYKLLEDTNSLSQSTVYLNQDKLFVRQEFSNPEIKSVELIYYAENKEISRIELLKSDLASGVPVSIGYEGLNKFTSTGACWKVSSGGTSSIPQLDFTIKDPCNSKHKAANLPEHINIAFKPDIPLTSKQNLATFKANSWMRVATTNIESITINEINQVSID